MNLPNFKDILKVVLEKLSVFKNNLSLLIPVIIVFVSVVIFIPTQLMSSGLKKTVTAQSIDKGVKPLKNLQNRYVPDEQLEIEKESMEEFANDANEILLLAKQTTQRQFFNDSIFSLDPNDPNKPFSHTIFFEFGQEYRDRIDDFIASNNVCFYPTEDEINKELEALDIDNVLQSGSSLINIDLSSGTSQQDEMKGMIIDQICRKRAESGFVYIDQYQISGYEFWGQYQFSSLEEDIENCWYSQLGYWIIEDLFATIVSMNTGYDNLMDAPVKRLMNVNFLGEEISTLSKSKSDSTAKKYTDRPYYILSTEDIPKETLSGRYCNEDYDVVHFKATFVINTKDFLRFTQELCSSKEHEYTDETGQTHTFKHNQITVLDTSIKSVDMRSTDHELYRYGNDNVSEVELTCEYIFNRKGYEDVMPVSVKNILGILE